MLWFFSSLLLIFSMLNPCHDYYYCMYWKEYIFYLFFCEKKSKQKLHSTDVRWSMILRKMRSNHVHGFILPKIFEVLQYLDFFIIERLFTFALISDLTISLAKALLFWYTNQTEQRRSIDSMSYKTWERLACKCERN